MGSILGSHRAMAKYVRSYTFLSYVRCATLIVCVGGMPWLQTGATQFHAQLGLPDKGRAIAPLGCYQPSPEERLLHRMHRSYIMKAELENWLKKCFFFG